MGLLDNFLVGLDNKRRMLGVNVRGLLDDPVGHAGLLGRGIVEELAQMSRSNLLNADASMSVMPEVRAQANAAALPNMVNLLGATVWHGSPHAFRPTKNNPLGEFDPTKIGTGEGAQAYGYGHYLADMQGLAKGYRDKLAKNEVLLDGQKVTHNRSLLDPQSMGLNALQMEPSPSSAAAALRKAVADESLWTRGSQYDHRERYAAAADWLEQNAKRIKVESGSLYKVDLPDDAIAKMLDWDAPLSKQPKAVQEALKDAPPGMYIDPKSWATRWRDEPQNGAELYQALERKIAQEYPGATKGAMPPPGFNAREIVSAKLREMGIPGIKYLDAGSRGAGDGTRNYVVFPGNEDLLKILERQ